MKNDLSALQRAALAIDELRRRLAAAEEALQAERAAHAGTPIAIAGLACRFPGGANTPAAYWALLADGRNGVRAVPPDRWTPGTDEHPSTRSGGFLDDVAHFDARFFDIAPREAAHMDPQHRLLLECAWHALEDAGLPPDRLAGTPVGVYLGISTSDYAQMLLERKDLSAYYLTGNPLNAAAGRISHTLGLTGPSIVFDTACSSAAVAIHHAVQALQQGDCDLAIAGGANLILSRRGGEVLAAGGMLAADGRCKTFDASADGYVRGEGVGLVVLQRLADRPAGARTRAVLLGTAVTHDGASSGFTVPSGAAQRRAIEVALRKAGLQPADVDFVECHGTGTALGDPIEVRALAAVFGEGPRRAAPLALGAVKTHLGHLEAAAASAGLIKTVLALENECIPANLHLQQPNPEIAWDDMPLEPARAPRPWPRGSKRRVAGVSSFGASGTNVHLVVAEAPDGEAPAPQAPAFVPPLLLSAKSRDALAALAAAYLQRLEHGTPYAALALNTALRRTQLPWRIAVPAAGAADALRAFAAGQGLPERAVPRTVRWTFAFDPVADEQALRDAADRAQSWREWGLVPAACTGQGTALLAAAVSAGAVSWKAAAAWLALPAPRPALALEGASAVPLVRYDGSPMPAVLTEADLGAAPADTAAPGPGMPAPEWRVRAEPHAHAAERLAQAFLSGARIDWRRVLGTAPVAWVDLPSYPFARERHWFSRDETPALAPAAAEASVPATRPRPVLPAPHASLAQLFQRQLDETAQALRSVVGQQLAWLHTRAAVPGAATHPSQPLESAPAPVALGPADNHELLAFSAQNDAELNARLQQAAAHLAGLAPSAWSEYAAELRSAARAGDACAVLVAASPSEAADVLQAAARGDTSRQKGRRVIRAERPARAPRLSMLFSGLGDQYPGMGAELYRRLPVFRAALDRCAERLAGRLGSDVREAMFRTDSGTDAPGPLAATRIAHPALVALQCALVAQWRAWGIVPSDALGYSLGDYAAAAMAGVFSEEAVLALVAARAELIEAQAAGAMLAVPLAPEHLQPHLPPGAYLAAISTPATSIASGTPEAIAQLGRQLAADKIPARPLQAERPFHCSLLAPLAAPLHALVVEARPQPACLPLVSGTTGEPLPAGVAQSADYWVRHTLEPVRFAQGVATLLEEPQRFFLEIGPGQALSSFVFQHPRADVLRGRPVAASLPNRDDPKHETAFALETLGRLWLAGFAPDWNAVATCLRSPAPASA